VPLLVGELEAGSEGAGKSSSLALASGLLAKSESLLRLLLLEWGEGPGLLKEPWPPPWPPPSPKLAEPRPPRALRETLPHCHTLDTRGAPIGFARSIGTVQIAADNSSESGYPI